MEMSGSYDLLNGTYLPIEEDESSEDVCEAEKQENNSGRRWKHVFQRKNNLKKSLSHDNVSEASKPGYWDVSLNKFARVLHLKPQSDGITNMQLKEKVQSDKKVKFAMLKQLKSFIHMKSNEIEIKILIMGDKSVGKSAIIQRFVHGTFDFEGIADCTGYETKLMKFQNNKQFCLHLFEISGDISDAIVSPTCVSDSIGAIIVFDINDDKSFESIKNLKKCVDSKAKLAKRGQIPCLLIASKCDSPDITFDMCELDDFCSKQGIQAWFDTSAKNDFNIKNAFVFLMQCILSEQGGFSSLGLMMDKKKCLSNVKISFRRRNHLYDEESTTML